MMTDYKTEKLYYADSHILRFEAVLLRCDAISNGRYAAVLDKTAFFPEGGGQLADTGFIGPAAVLDVQEKNGEILHYLSADLSCALGQTLSCALDAEQRLRRMQNHSGEHIVSGLVHNAWGFENVGFHMSKGFMTIDFSGELTWQQLLEVERLANEAVRANLPIRTYFPAPEELPHIEYRSKLELTENVRLVEIDGIDRCACCAPHVHSTGEIGIIKILSCERHRGGVRVELVCGMDALDNFNARQQSVAAISALLSAKREEVTPAVEHLLAERDALKARTTAIENECITLKAASCPETSGSHCFIFGSGEFSEGTLRELVNLLLPKAGSFAAAFWGDDAQGYRYIIASRTQDMRAAAREINTALNGRGGGRGEMISGSCNASATTIRAFFSA